MIEILLGLTEFLICLIITVFFHELAHMVFALLFKTKVKTFCIGFGKPYLSYKYKGIDFRLTPWLLGGYCDIDGMDTKRSSLDFLTKKYYQKFIILVAGVTVNFIIACICYLINFGSIKFGLYIDFELLKAIFTNNYDFLYYVLPVDTNFFILQLSLLNLFCAIGNLIPIPPLDGGLIWLYAIYDKISKSVREWIIKFGWVVVMGGQVYLIGYIYSDYFISAYKYLLNLGGF